MILKIKKYILAVLILQFIAPFVAICQDHDYSGLNSTFHRSHVSKASTHQKIKAIYKRPSKNRMFSNDCVHNYTVSEMGFEYVILTGDCEKTLGNRSGFELELQNFGTEIGLFFRRGPFWKSKVKKRYKFCKERMGDTID
jgi:hypothetical protein